MEAEPFAPDAPPPLAPDEEAKLWEAYKEKGSARARERLFIKFLPLARRIAWRYVRDDNKTPVDHKELVQLSSVGLLEAIDHFRPELGVPFKYFCTRRISGAIVSGLTKLSEVNQQISTRKAIARERLKSVSAGVARPKSTDEALDVLGDIAAGLALGLMLDNAAMYHENERDPSRDAYETLAWKQVVEHVKRELERLPERERNIVRYHYLEGMSFDHIASLFGLTKGRISQIHKAAIALLRKRLSKLGQFRLEG